MNALSVAALSAEPCVNRLQGDGGVLVGGVRHDSRTVEPGDLFVAMGGRIFDGADYTSDALRRGAVAIAAAAELDVPVPLLVVEDAERALSALSARVYGNPTQRLPVIGVTGTNGKTTVAYLVEQMLVSCEQTPATFGTVGIRGPAGEIPATHTTPMADDVMRLSKWALESGASEIVMEVSSHGLAMKRVEDVQFAVAAFTNLTQDHLDFHGDIEAYGAAKARLFFELNPKVSVINIDDAFGRSMAEHAAGAVLSYSAVIGESADIQVQSISLGRDGVRATVQTPEGTADLESKMLGLHNLSNLLCALGVGIALGHNLQGLARGLNEAQGAPGRLQRVLHPGDVNVFVDYAHTPDALARVCDALIPSTAGRLIVVFGCGGDRDRSKRPLMAAAVAARASVAILTSDNPRNESPARILNDMVPGMTGMAPADPLNLRGDGGAGLYCVVEDRRDAIEQAVAVARPGDTVLIAGKGHEQSQLENGVKTVFDDVQVAAEAIQEEGQS